MLRQRRHGGQGGTSHSCQDRILIGLAFLRYGTSLSGPYGLLVSMVVWSTRAVLVLLATGLVVIGIYQVVATLVAAQGPLRQRLLMAVGYVVISIAVFDVAKYLIEEEVIRDRELRHVSEVRHSPTRFTATVLIAVFLEAGAIGQEARRQPAPILCAGRQAGADQAPALRPCAPVQARQQEFT
jgi:hypothetical protein